MKITREALKQLILESIRERDSLLLEMPEREGTNNGGNYIEDSDEDGGEVVRRSLFHMSQQAQQLHDMLKGVDKLEPWVQASITKAADNLEEAFKAITYDKQNPEGM